LFDGMTPAQQEQMLTEALKEVDTERGNILALTTAWKAGDAPAVERIVLDDVNDDPVLYQRLLVERNRAWLPKLEALVARNARAFVVVGAAHLIGPDGLLAMFKAKGFKVEQL
jgi:uncharacterized protein YbaP (TraB family)